jgi:hypothetical protein
MAGLRATRLFGDRSRWDKDRVWASPVQCYAPPGELPGSGQTAIFIDVSTPVVQTDGSENSVITPALGALGIKKIDLQRRRHVAHIDRVVRPIGHSNRSGEYRLDFVPPATFVHIGGHHHCIRGEEI